MLISSKTIIVDSVKLYRKNIKQCLLAALPLFLLTVAIFILSAMGTLLGWGGTIVSWTVVGINFLLFFVTLWFASAFILTIARIYKQYPDVSLRASLHSTRVRFISILFTVILTFLVILATSLALIIPGIIFSVLLFFTLYSVVIDDISPKKVLRYNMNLVWGRWWATLWRLFVPFVVFTLPLFLVESVLDRIFQNLILSSTLNEIIISSTIISVIAAIISYLAAPIFIANTVILYESLKQNPK